MVYLVCLVYLVRFVYRVCLVIRILVPAISYKPMAIGSCYQRVRK